jgi:hypothetical protein
MKATCSPTWIRWELPSWPSLLEQDSQSLQGERLWGPLEALQAISLPLSTLTYNLPTPLAAEPSTQDLPGYPQARLLILYPTAHPIAMRIAAIHPLVPYMSRHLHLVRLEA